MTTKQNVILSRINAAGAIQESTGVADGNKLIKTTAAGTIHPSLVAPGERWDDSYVYFPPVTFGNSELPTSNLIVVKDEIDATSKDPVRKFTGYIDGQNAENIVSLQVDSDSIAFNATAAYHVEAKYSDVDAANTLDIDIYKNDTLVQTNSIALDVSYADEAVTRAETVGVPDYTFDTGDLVHFVFRVGCKGGQSVYIRKFYALFDVYIP